MPTNSLNLGLQMISPMAKTKIMTRRASRRWVGSRAHEASSEMAMPRTSEVIMVKRPKNQESGRTSRMMGRNRC